MSQKKHIEINFTCLNILGDPTKDVADCVAEWDVEQAHIAKSVNLDAIFTPNKIKYLGGVDITFTKADQNQAIACLVIHDFATKELVATFTMKCTIVVPYVPYYLAYREVPAYLELINFVRANYPELIPNAIIVDGNGVWHPRQCGCATALAIFSNIPCVGVAKKFLQTDGKTQRADIDAFAQLNAPNKGDFATFTDAYGRVLGNIFNVTGSVKKLTYISVGSGMTLDCATQIVTSFGEFRNNEAVRQADLLSRKMAK
jgi:deoxyinosine 3'endonuclease (endonuclease V)